jgi:hypothetical protein
MPPNPDSSHDSVVPTSENDLFISYAHQGDHSSREAVTALVDSGVLEEISGKKRDRSFGYAGYLDLLKAGTGLER